MLSDSEGDDLERWFNKAPAHTSATALAGLHKRRTSSDGSSSSVETTEESDVEMLGNNKKRSRKRRKQVPAVPNIRTLGAKATTSSGQDSDAAPVLSVESSPPLGAAGFSQLGFPSDTQRQKSLREMAKVVRDLGGQAIEPPSPPPRNVEANRSSVSTEPTSLSDAQPPTKKKRKAVEPATISRVKGKAKAKPAPPPKSPSPQPDLDAPLPSPPRPFWNTDARPEPARKRQHGEATKALKKLSEQFRPPKPPEPEFEIISDSDDEEIGLGEQQARPPKYETMAAKQKRLREEQKKQLEASRAARQANKAGPTAVKGANSIADQLHRQAKQTMTPCPICNKMYPTNELTAHTNACLDETAGHADDGDNEPEGGPESEPRGARPSVDPISSPPPPAAPRDLAAELFPPSASPPPAPPPQRYTAVQKGKGRAPLVEAPIPQDDHDGEGDDEQAEDEYGQYDFGDGAGDDDQEEDGDEEWEDPAGFANLHGTYREVLEIDSEDDIEVQQSGGKRAAGSVNSKRRKGPPRDGSSPPAGSIYTSTLPSAVAIGYDRLYTVKTTKKGVEVSRDPLAPQKMSAPVKAPVKRAWRGRGARRGGRGGAGGGRKRAASRK